MEKKTTKAVEKPAATNDGKYHVTKHPDGGWQVILGKGEKAVRRTKTQEEALQIANELAEARHTTVYLHGKKGTIREAKTFKEEPKKPAKKEAKPVKKESAKPAKKESVKTVKKTKK